MEEDKDIQNMTHKIAEVFNENVIDVRRAKPILWMLLKRILCIEEKRWDFDTRHIKYNWGKLYTILTVRSS